MTLNIILGFLTLASPIIAYFAIKAYEERFLQLITSKRKEALKSIWYGTFKQAIGPNGEEINGKVKFSFTTSRKIIIGKGTYIVNYGGSEISLSFNFKGGFLYDRYLRFEYYNKDPSVIQFGSAILELSPDAKKLTGRFHGYGSETKSIVYGELNLNREN